MLINIYFAIIALSALCIDIILNRGLIDEINDESIEFLSELKKAATDAKQYNSKFYRSNKDTIGTLIKKLLKKVKESCASNRAQPFYVIVIALSVGVIVSAGMDTVADYITDNKKFDTMYSIFGTVGWIIWVSALIYCIRRIISLRRFKITVEADRQIIKDKVEGTIMKLRLIAGNPDPSSPFEDIK